MGKEARTDLLIKKMKAKRYDPMDSLIDIAMDADTPLDMRIDCHKILAKHTYPTLKSVEMEANVQTVFNIQLEDFASRLKEKNNVIPIEGKNNDESATIAGDGQGRDNKLPGGQSNASSSQQTDTSDAAGVSSTQRPAEA